MTRRRRAFASSMAFEPALPRTLERLRSDPMNLYARAMKASLPLPLLLLAACATHSDAPAPRAPANPAPTDAAAPLEGPFADLPALWGHCRSGWDKDESVTTVLAEQRAPDGPAVSLRSYSNTPAAGSCAVTIETAAGLYVGSFFLCAADRSDELVSTKDVTISTTPTEATIDFSVSYLQGDFVDNPDARKLPPAVSHHVIHCNLAGTAPQCTAPPDIGGYVHSSCDEH